jgi:ABC-type transport system involved in multi-copper enzyme maturation permease subunit
MQLWAIFTDTFRSLRTRGLFWIILSISLTLGLTYASLGCYEQGWSLLFGMVKIPSDHLRVGTDWERSLLLNCLHGLLDWWCMFFASVLALFATSTIFPDTMQPGAIDLLLSKPLSRFKLFMGKYIAGLWFVALQTFILVAICFLSLCWRVHTAYWHLFWSVGLVVLIFSFIFCVSTLLGIFTRSSITALLWSILFWFVLWAVQKTEHETNPNNLLRAAQTLGPGFAKASSNMENIHRITSTTMKFLPRTRQTGELFTQLIKADAPYSFEQILFHNQAAFLQNLTAPVPANSVWDTISSGVYFQLAILLIAFRRFQTRDF